MAKLVMTDLDFSNVARIVNLPDGTLPQHPATVAQVNALIEGLAWKDDVVVATQGNMSLTTPGAVIDGVTMNSGDRVLLRAQDDQKENGIYIWTGAAVALTRSSDADEGSYLNQAVVPVVSGTAAGTTYRQSVVSPVIGSTNITFVPFATGVSYASETISGTAEIATQAEVDAGTDDTRIVTPYKLKNSALGIKRYSTNIGDGSATSFTVTHNLNTRDVLVTVYRTSGTYAEVIVDIERTDVNTITVKTASAPAVNALRVVISA